jgi:hypothetical protein
MNRTRRMLLPHSLGLTSDNTKVAASARFARSGVHASLCARRARNL